MTNEEFKRWVAGFLTLSDDVVLTRKQYTIIKNHSNLSKAVIGSLDESILQFMSKLDLAMNQNSQISMSDLQQYQEWK